jgi:hypothetical protein
MTTLMQASRQWAARPADERYASLLDMQSYMTRRRDRSRAAVESTRALTVMPDESDPLHRGLFLGIDRGPLAGQLLAPTHQAFGQICSLAATPSPASYFRESKVPADIIADALNFNLRFTRDVEDVGVLATMGDEDNGLGVPTGSELRAATGPAYGRIWDADIVDALVERFGDGVSGHWRVPGGRTGHRRPRRPCRRELGVPRASDHGRNHCTGEVTDSLAPSACRSRAIGRLEAPEHPAPEGDLEWASLSSPGWCCCTSAAAGPAGSDAFSSSSLSAS